MKCSFLPSIKAFLRSIGLGSLASTKSLKAVPFLRTSRGLASGLNTSSLIIPPLKVGLNSLRMYHALSEAQPIHPYVFKDSRKAFDGEPIFFIYSSLQSHYPDCTVTMVHSSAGLLDFAKAGKAKAEVNTDGQNLLSWLKYEPPKRDRDIREPGKFQDLVKFGRYDYQWNENYFLVYMYCAYHERDPPEGITYFILRKRAGDQIVDGQSSVVKDLVAASSSHTNEVQEGDVLVWDDDSWNKSKKLWKSVQKSKWENVILDSSLKDNLIRDVEGFFDQKEHYDQFEVPYKRGILIHGLPGNGKTITMKALMKSLASRPVPIPTLYVKSGKDDYGTTFAIRHIFKKARQMTPCLLVFEDLDSLITEESRSFFLNEVDGMESNDGIMMIGSTNYLEKLDSGITKRPSRFDRKYHFDLPATPERTRYCDFWRSRLANNKAINFPEKMSAAIAGITDGFSFAYLQEAFISSLLVMVNEMQIPGDNANVSDEAVDGDSQNLETVMLWLVMKKQVETLRNEIKGSKKSAKDALEYIGPKQVSKTGFA